MDSNIVRDICSEYFLSECVSHDKKLLMVKGQSERVVMSGKQRILCAFMRSSDSNLFGMAIWVIYSYYLQFRERGMSRWPKWRGNTEISKPFNDAFSVIDHLEWIRDGMLMD